MTFSPQEQETTVEERGKDLFRDHIGQFLFFAVFFLGVSELYLFSVKSKNVFIIGGQMLFTTFCTSVI